MSDVSVPAEAEDIRQSGETPFLRVAAWNSDAIRLYERLGFVIRRRVEFVAVVAPEHDAD
ncbi:MAG: GNAT family N-acetyltransferase [Actinomycetota bacterium]|nr:GNAT family N-acetyltransferase [Actinomycetota bacterium]